MERAAAAVHRLGPVLDWIYVRRWLVLLAVVAAVALGLRLEGLDWDNGRFYHPDERSIYLRADCMHRVLTERPGWDSCQDPAYPLDEPGLPNAAALFDKDASPLNTHWFPLSTIAVYVIVGVRFLLEPLMDGVDLRDLAAAGRTITALVDTGTVVLMFLLGRRLFGPAAGLLAAAFAAFMVVNIQLAHFYRPEPFIIFLAPLTFWWMLNVIERGRLRDHAMLGAVIGVTFAFRGSSLPMLAPVALTYLVIVWRQRQLGLAWGAIAGGAARPAVLAAGTALLLFAALQPYALIDYREYAGDLGWEVGMTRNAGSVPFTVQYVGTPQTGLYELRQTSLWALGLPLGIAAWGGLAATVVHAFRRPRYRDWLLLAWVLTLLAGIVTLFEVKFLRYTAPVLPVMALMGSRWLVEAYRAAKRRSELLRRAAAAAIAVVAGATVFYALAFAAIYREDHPAVQAAAWTNENVEHGSVILTDNHWDEGFPDLGRYAVSQLRMYEPDTFAKIARLSERLAGGDYIMAYSNRPWGSIARLPERYPYSSAYYRALFSGELGYELVQGFANYPKLAGVSFVHDPFTRAGVQRPERIPGVESAPLALDLGYADENVVNYDHPLVLVWQNTGRLSAAEMLAVITPPGDQTAPERAMLNEDRLAEQRASGTWTDIFDEGGPNAWAPWLVWLLAVEAVFIAALPLAARLLRWLPDRGVALARPLGLLLLSWLVWMGASTGLWTFSRGSVALSLLVIAAASGVVLYRNRWLLAAAKRQWKYLAAAEALFIAAYLAFVLVRAANPDLWHPWRGGEKPMDIAYLTAVVKSASFPPFDPWYAGGHINYYYYGFVIVGALIRLTGIVPEVAYNLAVPLLFALTFTAVFGVGYNLAEALRQRGRSSAGRWSAAGAGVAAALAVTVLANVDGAVQLLQGAARSLGGEEFGRFDFWRSSRLMPGQIAITEFPFFTFLFADLHPHLLSLPFQAVAVGLAANVVIGARSTVSLVRLMPAVAVLGFVVGSFAAMNTWDVPAYALLGLAALAIAVLTRRGSALEPMLFAKWLLLAALFWAVLYGAWLPFHQQYDSPLAGVKLSQWRTVFWHYLGIHALLIFAAGSWTVFELRRRAAAGGRPSPDAAPTPDAVWRRRFFLLAGAQAVLTVGGAWLTIDALREWTTAAALLTLALAASAVGVGWLARRRDREAPVHLLLVAALVIALGIGIGVDLVTVQDDIDRMNTVFKLYLNAWVLLGVVAGVGLWRLWTAGAMRVRGVRRERWRGAWLAVLTLLMLASAVYPVLGTRARLADRFDTTLGLALDGRAFQRTAVYGDSGPTASPSDDVRYALAADAAAIDFIRESVEGTPVFLEAVTDHAYRWYPKVANYAGLPVVVGWQWHQIQQRGAAGREPAAVRERTADVALMYQTADEARFLDLAAKYRVEYVYVGPTERVYFGGPGLDKFERMAGDSLDVFFTNGAVTIYRLRAEGSSEKSESL